MPRAARISVSRSRWLRARFSRSFIILLLLINQILLHVHKFGKFSILDSVCQSFFNPLYPVKGVLPRENLWTP
jgi:hypothetical protein